MKNYRIQKLSYGDYVEYVPQRKILGLFWCDVCDYYYGGELGKCPECGTKGNYKKIKYDRKRNSFNV